VSIASTKKAMPNNIFEINDDQTSFGPYYQRISLDSCLAKQSETIPDIT